MSNGYDHHRGEVSWWNGDLKTLCGLRIPSKDHHSEMWHLFGPKNPCPTCEAINKRNKRK